MALFLRLAISLIFHNNTPSGPCPCNLHLKKNSLTVKFLPVQFLRYIPGDFRGQEYCTLAEWVNARHPRHRIGYHVSSNTPSTLLVTSTLPSGDYFRNCSCSISRLKPTMGNYLFAVVLHLLAGRLEPVS
jgi:hypothetical protein